MTRAVSLAIVGVTSLLAATACGNESTRGIEPAGAAAGSSASVGSVTSAPGATNRAALETVTSVADSLYAGGAYDSARVVYQQALASATTLGDSAAVARIVTSLGLAAWRLGDYSEARRLGLIALDIKHRRAMRADLFRSYNALGLLARDEGQIETAQAMFDSALTTARERGDQLNVAKATSNVALLAQHLGDLEAARTGYIAARDGGRSAGDLPTEWNATVSLASIDVRLGNPLAAIAAVEDLRRRYPAPNHPVGEENALGQLATAYDLLGESQRAIAALDSAIRIAHASGLALQEAEDLKLLAEIYERTGDRRRALAVLDSAAGIASAIGAPDEIADVFLRRATILGALGDATTARASAAKALAIHRDMHAGLDVLADLLVDAELAARAGASTDARERIAEATSLADSLRVPSARGAVALTRARIADEQNDPRAVLRSLTSARTDLASAGVAAEFEGDALAARAHRRLGQLTEAIARGRLAVAGVERIRTALGLGELRTAFVTDKAAVYADLVLSLLQVGRMGEALEVADRARSRALMDHIAEARLQSADSASAAVVLAERARVLRRIDALLNRLSSADAGQSRERGSLRARRSGAAAELSAARREYDELLVRHARRQSGAGRLAFEPTSAESVRRSLRADEALLEFLVTVDRTLIFVVRPDGVRVFTSRVSGDDLGGRVRLARDLLAHPRGAGVADANAEGVLRALYTALIDPVVASGDLTGVRRLVIVPHGALAYLPFAALRSASERALVEDYAVLYLPVAAALPALRRGGARLAPSPPLMGFAPFPAALTSSREEARRAAAGNARSRTFVGGSATESAVRGALQSDAIVHVASHGVMEAESPMFSRIELARGSGAPSDNGRLEVHEVLSLRVTSPLVFLSGCETGVGEAWSSRYAGTDDHATLEQAFLYAGARAVVATRWRVEDESAAAVADRFYAHLAGGAGDAVDAVDALAAAQRDLIRGRRFAAPHYWAAYAVSGAGVGLPAVASLGSALPASLRR